MKHPSFQFSPKTALTLKTFHLRLILRIPSYSSHVFTLAQCFLSPINTSGHFLNRPTSRNVCDSRTIVACCSMMLCPVSIVKYKFVFPMCFYINKICYDDSQLLVSSRVPSKWGPILNIWPKWALIERSFDLRLILRAASCSSHVSTPSWWVLISNRLLDRPENLSGKPKKYKPKVRPLHVDTWCFVLSPCLSADLSLPCILTYIPHGNKTAKDSCPSGRHRRWVTRVSNFHPKPAWHEQTFIYVWFWQFHRISRMFLH